MNAAPRVVHVFSTFGRGGPQVRATQLIARLGAPWQHTVIAMDGNIEAAALLPSGSGGGPSVQFVERPRARGFFGMRRGFAERLRELRPDLVLTYNWGAIEAVAGARRAGLPLVHHEDGFGPEEAARRLRRRSWLRRWLLRSVPVIVPSSVLTAIAAREWGLRPADVHHLVNGVDLTRFQPGEPTAGGGHRRPLVVGTVGGLRGEKDHATLLAAIARLGDAGGAAGGDGGGDTGDAAAAPVRCDLVGEGPLRRDLERQAAQLGIGDRVVFAGQTADTAPCYRGFDVFVLSSRTEQMPIAMLEAMASGLPVVASDVGDVRRVLPAAALDAGCVVPPQDPAALADALRRVLRDAALRTRLGAANRALVAERYEAGVCLDRFLAVYRAAMARR